MNAILFFANAAPTVPAPVADTCTDDFGGGICEWVLDYTDGNTNAARLADWLIGRPLAILTVLLGAWILRTISRWMIRRGVRHMMTSPVFNKTTATNQQDNDDAAVGDVDVIKDEIDYARRVARSGSISSAMSSTVGVIIWTSAIISIAGILGFELRALVAGAGVIGVALGFGAQSLVRDCINGIFMLLEDQYGIGDTVDLGEASGDVERVSLRTTVLRGIDGTVWHVPNGEIRRVGNQSQLWSMAIVDVVVANDSDIGQVTELLESTALSLGAQLPWANDILEPPRVLGVESVDADGTTVRLRIKTTPGRQWAVQRALREAIKAALESAGIALPLPQRAVWMNAPRPSDQG